MHQKVATIFGATGFIGRHVVRHFADNGFIVRVVSRSAKKTYFLRVFGDVGQVVSVQAHHDDPGSVDSALRGADVAVFLPGVLHAGRKGFGRVHTDYPAQVAEACARHHVGRLVHVSALACERGQSLYAQTKRAGEEAVLQAFPKAVILRPSLVFGNEDGFFGRFAQMARVAPALPLIGGGHTKFQPVFVGDVAKAVFAAATMPARGANNPEGRIYELGGPGIYSFKDLMGMMFAQTGQTRALIPVPFALATLKASVLQLLPVPPLTVDQVKSLKTDSIVSSGSFGLADLGITATSLEAMLPGMMARYRDGGPCAQHIEAA